MKPTDEQALNKKLAEWRGFEWWSIHPQEELKSDSQWRPLGGTEVLINDAEGDMPILEIFEGEEWKSAPNFPDSLDACFKWLVPKVLYQTNLKNVRGGWICMFFNSGREPPRIEAIGKTPALALCLAIEKLIDETSS